MKKKTGIWCLIALALVAWVLCAPWHPFRGVPYATVVESTEGELLGARIADDGQWRFPPCDTVPERFAAALVQFEDRQFWWHPGVNPVALVRAAVQNARAGHVVSGGSTLTMQVIRLSRGKERTLWQKIIEALQATSLELRYSKRHILSLYASHAPFGGNVVGLEAAAWRYFGRPPGELSWAEAATLAVLPNAPSSIHIAKGRDELLQKRNRLLLRLLKHGDIDQETYEAAVDEPLPSEPMPLPSLAYHYVEAAPHGERTRTSIRYQLQKSVEAAASKRSDDLAEEGIADLAVVVMDNTTGSVVAYVGNASINRKRPGVQVDIAKSPRSTGSILKPFLFEAALADGVILPRTLLPDVPVNLGGFAPQNFDRQFYGAVPASEALARSLNVPAVFLLRSYGVPKFHALLKSYGLTTLSRTSETYGLSLILGGGEGRLDEITAAYSLMVRRYMGLGGPVISGSDRESLWYTFEALKEVNRPDELDWRLIRSVRKAAWKTGTSYGFRDAWAVGMTPRWTIGVWAGNAEGQGVPGLVGARVAGPVLFEVLNLLPADESWFPEPELSGPDGPVWAKVCRQSGYLASPDCDEALDQVIPRAGLESAPCPYHSGGVFALPPAMEWYYKPHHPEYVGVQKKAASDKVMEFIYPDWGTTLTIPRQLDGQVEGAVFRVAHRHPDTTLWWHLDNEYVGETRFQHEMRLNPSPGQHYLTVVDGDGNSATVAFTVRQRQ